MSPARKKASQPKETKTQEVVSVRKKTTEATETEDVAPVSETDVPPELAKTEDVVPVETTAMPPEPAKTQEVVSVRKKTTKAAKTEDVASVPETPTPPEPAKTQEVVSVRKKTTKAAKTEDVAPVETTAIPPEPAKTQEVVSVRKKTSEAAKTEDVAPVETTAIPPEPTKTQEVVSVRKKTSEAAKTEDVAPVETTAMPPEPAKIEAVASVDTTTITPEQVKTPEESPTNLSEADSQAPIESVAEKEEEKAEKPPEDPSFFQAIGVLYGKVIRNEQGEFHLKLAGQEYRLFVLRHRYRRWLMQMENVSEVSMYLRVYPKILTIPKQPMVISFQVVAWSTEPFPDTESGIFIFKGIWQFLPQFKTPCLSVYRNRNATDPSGKFKAAHLPVLMRREEEEVKPFRFNPKIPKEELPRKWFIQGKFRFMPSRQCFGWVEDLAPPTQKLPKYTKPVKAIPTDNPKPEDNKEKPPKNPQVSQEET